MPHVFQEATVQRRRQKQEIESELDAEGNVRHPRPPGGRDMAWLEDYLRGLRQEDLDALQCEVIMCMKPTPIVKTGSTRLFAKRMSRKERKRRRSLRQ